MAAGREPRAAAEDLRQMLVEQLGQSYSEVKVEFKALEDFDTIVNVGGTNMAMAHYVLTVNFKTAHRPKPRHARAVRTHKAMNQPNLKKDQIQKMRSSAIGFVVLIYIYFSFFLGPLNREPRHDARHDQRHSKQARQLEN